MVRILLNATEGLRRNLHCSSVNGAGMKDIDNNCSDNMYCNRELNAPPLTMCDMQDTRLIIYRDLSGNELSYRALRVR